MPRKRKLDSERDKHHPLPRTIPAPVVHEVEYMDLDRLRLYEQALQAMEPDDQLLLVGHFIYGYEQDYLAHVLGVADGSSVRYRIARALRRVRAALGVTLDG